VDKGYVRVGKNSLISRGKDNRQPHDRRQQTDDGLHGSSFNDDPLADIHDHRPAQLTDKKILPQGVVSKNLKVVLYIVATAILAIAVLFSGGKKKP